jgi:hypothetical protein
VIDTCDDGFELLYCERGDATRIHAAPTLDELLFLVLRDATRRVDIPGIEHSDHRRRAFPKQLELMGRVSSQWSERLRQEHAEELAREPFDDEKFFRIAPYNKLLTEGHTAQDAERLACDRYPRPR